MRNSRRGGGGRRRRTACREKLDAGSYLERRRHGRWNEAQPGEKPALGKRRRRELLDGSEAPRGCFPPNHGSDGGVGFVGEVVGVVGKGEGDCFRGEER